MNVGFEHLLAIGIYGAVTATLIRDAVDAFGDWRAARAARRQWGQIANPLEVSPRLAITWKPNRLRYRRHDMGYSYADLSDTPYVAPTAQTEIKKGRSEVASLEARNPELAAKLKSVARQLVAELGAITSADVWSALDPATREQAKKVGNGKIMAVAFNGSDWRKTGRYLPKGSHGRPVSEWTIGKREAA